MVDSKKCSKCAAAISDGEVDWPGPNDGDVLCQNCWESYADGLWWQAVVSLPDECFEEESPA